MNGAKPVGKIQAYERHSVCSDLSMIIAEIKLRMLDPGSTSKCIKVAKLTINGLQVNAESTRLRTFATKGCSCAACGLTATFAALERTAGNGSSYHLNFYGMKDEEEVLFTHDHILARGLGGANSLSNTQTMCCWCNWEKGVGEREQAKALRALA